MALTIDWGYIRSGIYKKTVLNNQSRVFVFSHSCLSKETLLPLIFITLSCSIRLASFQMISSSELNIISDLNSLTTCTMDSSRLQGFLSISSTALEAFASSNLDNKMKLQKIVFPEGLTYDRPNEVYRTSRVNSVILQIAHLAKVSDGKKNGNSSKNKKNSQIVPRAGIEPARYLSITGF